jgi:hypothetical protein
VGDEDEGEPVARLHVLEQVQDLGLHRHIERGHRLVADDHLRLEHERPGDRDPLALPAGELVGPPVGGHRGVEPHRLEHLVDPFLLLGVGAALPDAQRLRDDVLDLSARVQRRDRILEDELQPGADLAQLLAAERGEVDPLEEHVPAGRRRQLHDGAAGGGLAAARLADESQRLALAHVKADARHGVDGATLGLELDDEVFDAQEHVIAEVRGAGAGHQASLPASTSTSSSASSTCSAAIASPVTAASAAGT